LRPKVPSGVSAGTVSGNEANRARNRLRINRESNARAAHVASPWQNSEDNQQRNYSMRKLTLVAATLIMAPLAALAGETPAAPGSVQYFVNLQDGDTVQSPVKVIFGLTGMGVAPAGVDVENTGHHHLLIDRPALGEGEGGAEEFNMNMPADDSLLHFGKGQTETMIELAPGVHKLQLVLGDKDHIPHNAPVFSEVITITVE